MRKKTVWDEIDIDLAGSIGKAIAELTRLKALYPKGKISLENEYEYGESYARLKLRFTRPMEPLEIECASWREKRARFEALYSAAEAYEREGDAYPRAAELKESRAELGCFADPMSSLVIFGDEILAARHDGGRTRDGKWRWRAVWAPDMGIPE